MKSYLRLNGCKKLSIAVAVLISLLPLPVFGVNRVESFNPPAAAGGVANRDLVSADNLVIDVAASAAGVEPAQLRMDADNGGGNAVLTINTNIELSTTNAGPVIIADGTNGGLITISNNGHIGIVGGGGAAVAIDMTAANAAANLLINNTAGGGGVDDGKIIGDIISVPTGTMTINNNANASIQGTVTKNGAGILTLNNAAGASISGIVTGGTGNDVITNAGTLTAGVDFGAGGDNTLNQNVGSTITGGGVAGGAGNDTINLAGSIAGGIDFDDNTGNILEIGGLGAAATTPVLTGDTEASAAGNPRYALRVGRMNATNFTSGGDFDDVAAVDVGAAGGGGPAAVFTINHDLTTAGGGFGNFTVHPLATVNVNAGKTVNIAGNDFTNDGITVLNGSITADTFTNNGTFTVQGNAATIDGDYVSAGTHNARINAAAQTAETLTITGAGHNTTLNNGSTIGVIETSGSDFPIGSTEFTIITTAGGANAPIVNNVTLPASTTTLSYALAVDATKGVNGAIVLTATQTGFENLAGNSEVGEALDALGASGGDGAVIRDALRSLSTQEEIQAVVDQQLSPNTDTTFFTAASSLFDLPIQTIETHLTTLALAAFEEELAIDGETGMAAGDDYEQSRYSHRKPTFGVWVKPFGNTLNQRGRGTDDGFSSSTGGLEAGMDAEVFPNVWLGAAFSFANARVKTKTTPRNFTHINSYQGTLYAAYSPECYFVDGFVSFARNRYKSTRNIQFAGITRTAEGVFYGNQPSVKIRAGYKYKWNNLLFTPMVSLQYTYLHQNKYTETGANSINLQAVSTKDTSALDGGVGMTAAYIVNNRQYYQLTPQVHVMYTHDFLSEKQVTTTSFAGGGPAFVSTGTKPARGALHAGVGLTLKGKEFLDSWQLALTYDFEKKSRLEGHTAIAELKYLW